MRSAVAGLFVVVCFAAVHLIAPGRTVLADEPQSTATAVDAQAEPLAHIVFFTLSEPTDENRTRLVEACKKYLDKHAGVIYFGVGVNAPEYNGEVNDRDYDVALHLVFKSAQDQDAYQTHPRHVKFVEECQGLWKKVRVFDSKLK